MLLSHLSYPNRMSPRAASRHYDIPRHARRQRCRCSRLPAFSRGHAEDPGDRAKRTPRAHPTGSRMRRSRAASRFTHFNGMSGDLLMPEILGPGVALFDYDNDGDLDVFVPQGRMLGAGKTIGQALFPPRMPAAVRPPVPERPRGAHRTAPGRCSFTDVTGAERHTRDRVRHGRRDGRFRQRRLHRSVPDVLRREPAAPQQRRRHLHRRDGEERHVR